MPAFETMDYYDDVTIWARQGVDRHNQPINGTPYEIPDKARWTTTDATVTDQNGDKITLDAQLMTDEEIPLGSLAWLGSLDDWYVSGSGSDDSRLMEVKTRGFAKDLKARFSRTVYGLVKYRSSPT